jgi:hypothetical protein
MLGLQVYVNKSGLEHALLELIKVHASQNRHMAPEKRYAPRIRSIKVGAVARAPSSACGMKHRGLDGSESYGTQSGQLLHQFG